MSRNHAIAAAITLSLTLAAAAVAATGCAGSPKRSLYLDVHHLGAGHVTEAAVAEAHQKDLAVQGKYGVSFEKYWVDEKDGVVYCLAEAPNPDAIRRAHGEAHGLVPDEVLAVSSAR